MEFIKIHLKCINYLIGEILVTELAKSFLVVPSLPNSDRQHLGGRIQGRRRSRRERRRRSGRRRGKRRRTELVPALESFLSPLVLPRLEQFIPVPAPGLVLSLPFSSPSPLKCLHLLECHLQPLQIVPFILRTCAELYTCKAALN